MVVAIEAPSNGNLYRQTCSDRRVAVEILGDGQLVPDIEIPTMDVETTISKEGVSDRNRLTEARFPAEWRGKDVISLIDAFDPQSQSGYDTAKVHYQSVDSGEWYLTHYGYVRSVGATSDANELRMWISDVSDLLTAIPVNATYGVNTTIRQIFDDVAEGVSLHTIFDVEPRVRGNEALSEGDIPTGIAETGSVGSLLLWGVTSSTFRNVVKGTRSFKANRDTLADILQWVCDVTDARWYFEYDSDDGLVLVYDPHNTQRTFSDHHTDGGTSVSVIENDAYSEILPINSVTVNGQGRMSIKGFTKLAAQGRVPQSGKWPTATAIYEPLVNRTGQRLSPPIIEADAVTIEAANNMAKKELLDRIRGAPQGDIKLYGEPRIEPSDHFVGVPICGGTLDTDVDVPELDYEVERVVHRKEAGSEMQTRLEVSIFVDSDDITVDGKLTDGSEDATEDEESAPIVFGLPTVG